MEKKKIVGIVISLVLLSIIVTLVIMFVVWKNALLAACSFGDTTHVTKTQLDAWNDSICSEFMPAPWYVQFWVFLINLFNPITWALIF